MKRLAVILSMMACIFVPYQLYAAQLKNIARAIIVLPRLVRSGRFLVRYAQEHDWIRYVLEYKWWIVLFVVAIGIAGYFDDKKKGKQPDNNHNEELSWEDKEV